MCLDMLPPNESVPIDDLLKLLESGKIIPNDEARKACIALLKTLKSFGAKSVSRNALVRLANIIELLALVEGSNLLIVNVMPTPLGEIKDSN